VDEDQHYWLLDVYRERVSTDVRDKKIFQIASMDGVETRICIPQDPGSAGKSMKDYFIKMLAGFIVIPKIPSGTKEVRAEPVAIQINEGNLSLSRGAWNSVVLNEIGNFPYGANDDIIDALSDAFSEISKVRGRKFFAV
jgi:predicted phage terminase large subunit-like protein